MMEQNEPFHITFSRHLDRTLPFKRGKDSNQGTYDSISSLWKSELGETSSEFKEAIQSWYKDGATYWERTDIGADIEGVLGGIGFVHPDDISESAALLQQTEKELPGFQKRTAAELGGGIGRVTESLLSKHFSEVEVVEQSKRLLDKARERLEETCIGTKITYTCCSLQEWRPEKLLDCIWVQWVLGYLTDKDLLGLLKRCYACLSDNGVIVVKENVTQRRLAFWMDKDDRSIIRSREYFLEVFRKAGFSVLCDKAPEKWPAELFPLRVFVLYKGVSS